VGSSLELELGSWEDGGYVHLKGKIRRRKAYVFCHNILNPSFQFTGTTSPLYSKTHSILHCHYHSQTSHIPHSSLFPLTTLLLLPLTLRPLLLHPLATSRFARQLLHFAEPIAVGVALLAGSFHRVDAVLLVGLRGHVPGFGAGDGADGGLEAEGQLGFRVVGVRGGDDGFWVVKWDGMGWDGIAWWNDLPLRLL
jgi:hypothetical protein